ncbi:hypothetical protein KIW84_055662 [Lathyrus oleraceus]|uniref:Uncharacterized protein n=1 Tax=Pisum sativum TaxID=3888 RepID=A0A9D4WZ72_PEA|nr:hypothetical protein KIW84_055662 [Pisum sativum]
MYFCPCGPGYNVIDVYVKHNVGILDIVDDGELYANIEDDVQCIGFKSENGVAKDGTIDLNGVAEDVTNDLNGVAEDVTNYSNVVIKDVTNNPNVDVNNENGKEGIDDDYVAIKGSFEDNEFQFSEESEESEMDWTKAEMVHDESEDSYHLCTPPRSDDDDEGMKTADNKSAKTKWIANWLAIILIHSPHMKPSSLIAEDIKRYGVKLSHDKAYKAKRKEKKLVQEAGIEKFTHLRSYGHELLKSNPNNTIVIQCVDSNENHVFERIYVCLEVCKVGFAKTYKRAVDREISNGGNKPKKANKVKGRKGTKKSKEKQTETAQSSQAPQPTQE